MEELSSRLEQDLAEVVRRELKTLASSHQLVLDKEQNLKQTIQASSF